MTLALAKDNVELAAKNLKIRHSFTHIADTTELLSVVFAGFTSVLAFTSTANQGGISSRIISYVLAGLVELLAFPSQHFHPMPPEKRMNGLQELMLF